MGILLVAEGMPAGFTLEAGLAGADACLRQGSFTRSDLHSVLRAVIAKEQERRSATVVAGPFVLAREGQRVTGDGAPDRLPPALFEFFWKLAEASGKVVPYATLSPKGAGAAHTMACRLRKALGDHHTLVGTCHKLGGYYLAEEDRDF